MRISIVDDDIRMYERLQTYFGELLGAAAELTYFQSGEAFLRVWQPGAFELIVLDIFMEKLTGMDVAKEIRKTDSDVRLVFCTTSNEFASESYEVNACYYLHKPFDRDRVKAMLDRIDLAQIEKERTVQLRTVKASYFVISFTQIMPHIIRHCTANTTGISSCGQIFRKLKLCCAHIRISLSHRKGLLLTFMRSQRRIQTPLP